MFKIINVSEQMFNSDGHNPYKLFMIKIHGNHLRVIPILSSLQKYSGYNCTLEKVF